MAEVQRDLAACECFPGFRCAVEAQINVGRVGTVSIREFS